MNKLICLATVVGLLTSLTACSKKSEASTEVAAPEPVAAPANPAPPNPVATTAVQSLPEVTKAIEGGQYDSAVQTLVQIQPATAQMTDAQRLQYQQAVRDATTALLKAKAGNPAAQAAYDKLSRTATGR